MICRLSQLRELQGGTVRVLDEVDFAQVYILEALINLNIELLPTSRARWLVIIPQFPLHPFYDAFVMENVIAGIEFDNALLLPLGRIELLQANHAGVLALP